MAAAGLTSLLTSAGVSAGTAATVAGYAGTAGSVLGAVGTTAGLLSNIGAANARRYAALSQAQGVKEQAEQEKMRAREEASLRRERLLNALSAQNARAGAGGVQGGSIEALKLRQIEDYRSEQQGADAMSSVIQRGYQGQYSSLIKQGRQSQISSLLGTAATLKDIG